MNVEKFESLVVDSSSGWKERSHQNEWQKKAFDMALQILLHIRRQKITQVQLAAKMGVKPQYINRILQGKENLTLETICKIESAIGITLVEIPAYECIQVYEGRNDIYAGYPITAKSIGRFSVEIDYSELKSDRGAA